MIFHIFLFLLYTKRKNICIIETYERKLGFMAEIIQSILSGLLFIILIWFTYTIANIYVTMFKCHKLDHSLKPCLNTVGKALYIGLTLLYLVGFIGGVAAFIYGLVTSQSVFYVNGLNIAAFVSVIYGYYCSTLVLLGRKNMMVGRMMIDYRKIKKANFSYGRKMTFVYAQKDYSFSTRFVDTTQLKQAISRKM